MTGRWVAAESGEVTAERSQEYSREFPCRHSLSPAIERAWREGNRLFNEGRYFEAHEAWEQGWTRLPEPQRTRIQAVIQGAGCFVLLQKGRERAARSLARSALQKFARIRSSFSATSEVRVEVRGLQMLLRSLAEGREGADRILTKARALRAFLRDIDRSAE